MLVQCHPVAKSVQHRARQQVPGRSHYTQVMNQRFSVASLLSFSYSQRYVSDNEYRTVISLQARGIKPQHQHQNISWAWQEDAASCSIAGQPARSREDSDFVGATRQRVVLASPVTAGNKLLLLLLLVVVCRTSMATQLAAYAKL